MNGMVLAAGLGERMAPLSAWVPKPALDVLGRPLIASALAHLRRAGCDRVVVNLHRSPGQVAAAARAADGASLFSWEPELLGGAGGLAAARSLLGGGQVLVANADVWADLDLAPLVASAEPGTAILALLPHPDPARWSSVTFERDGRVVAFLSPGARGRGERYLFTGFELVGADVLAALPGRAAPMSAMWEPLRARGALRGAVVAGRWREVGTPAAYARLVAELVGPGPWVHPQASVSPDALLTASAVGAGCRVGPSATVAGSVLTAGAAVEDGAEVRGCVAAGPVRLAGRLADALILPSGISPLTPT